ncbi:MAG: peptidase M28 family protein [Deltaproteobacteria bacterium]|nr:MAG: peptidase M28 family protein [Deltaproteobacteria bacterium]
MPADPAPEPDAEPSVAWAQPAAERIEAHLETMGDRAWRRLAFVADTIGHRLSGSQGLERAIDWAVTELASYGLENARREKVKVPKWVRGREYARVVAPVERELVMLGLGGSVGTRGRLRAEVAVVSHVDEIAKRGKALAGKIVLIDQAMPPYDHEQRKSFYGETVQARSRGASEGAKVGAKAVLVRSVTARSLRTPHTGALRYEEGVPKIPAAAVTVEDAVFLARSVARGPVTVELFMSAKTVGEVDSANVVAEIPGRTRRDEIVLLGCHIDSWDVGDGSTDDMGGCIAVMEAARILVELELVPRRTVRVVLFTNEENGLRGAKAYHAAHGQERHVAVFEADAGQGAPLAFSVAGDDADLAALEAYAPLFLPFGVTAFVPGGAGADVSPFVADGVLGIGHRPDGSHYFDLHHSPADTVDKIDPDHLARNAASIALLAYILAERPEPEAPAAE